MDKETFPQEGYIRRFHQAELLVVSVSTIDRVVGDGSFPRKVKLCEKITAFDAVEINNWLVSIFMNGDHPITPYILREPHKCLVNKPPPYSRRSAQVF